MSEITLASAAKRQAAHDMEESSEHGGLQGATSFWATPSSSARLHSARLTSMSSSRQVLLGPVPPKAPTSAC